MTTIAYSRHVGVAKSHLGDPAPTDTCVELGMRAWPRELGLATLDTNSVTEAEQRARGRYNGWQYIEGTHGIQPGYYGDWKPSYLGSPTDRHVCVVELLDGTRWRGIGAGTPSGKVAHQPASGGYNPLTVLQGYFIPPTHSEVAETVKPAAVVKPPAGKTHTVIRGDTVWAIAKHYGITQAALLKANPRQSGGKRNADYHITSPSLIYIGQKLHIPA